MGDDVPQAYSHTNRKGDVYLLQAKRSGGKSQPYFFGRKLTGIPVGRVPEGYEVYEEPENAQVFVRRLKPTPILPPELRQVRDAVSRLAPSVHAIVQIEGKSIVIYVADIEVHSRLTLLRGLAPVGDAEAERMKQFMLGHASYPKTMRFTLIDADRRLFAAARWCFLGSIDNWFDLSYGPLAELLERYVPHLGQESFFELMG